MKIQVSLRDTEQEEFSDLMECLGNRIDSFIIKPNKAKKGGKIAWIKYRKPIKKVKNNDEENSQK